jgi:putative DNA primase/helicase
MAEVKKTAPLYLSDKHLAYDFEDRYQNKVRYCPQLGVWFIYDGKHWKASFDKAVFKLFDDWINQLKENETKKNKKIVNHLCKLNTQKRVLEYATRRLFIDQNQLDQDTVLVNFKNGTLNLETGQVSPHDPSQYITKIINYNYNPAATAPRWEQFLAEIMDNDQTMVDFLQAAAGYGLSGSVAEHVIFMFYGAGRNGKSTFVETIMELIGDYGHAVTNEFFASDKKDTHPTAIADLRGRRFVVGSEFTGNRLNEGLVKKLSGGDTQTARVMRGDYFKFRATHKFFMLVNDKPKIHGTDDGIWDRLKLVPFPRQFRKEDCVKDLQKKLINADQYAETGFNCAEGILSWVVEGARKFYQADSKIKYPLKVAMEGAAYKEENDTFMQFLEDEIELVEISPGTPDDKKRIRSMEITSKYHLWCDENGVRFKGESRWVHREMERKTKKFGVEFKRSNGSWWTGISWKTVNSTFSWAEMDSKRTANGQVKAPQTQSQQGNGQVDRSKPFGGDFTPEKSSANHIYLSKLSKMSLGEFKSLDIDSKLDVIEVAWMALHGEEKGRALFLEHELSMRQGSQDLLVDDFEVCMVNLKEKK